MIAMLAFISYYLFRQLGVLAFEGKEGFGGSKPSTVQCSSLSSRSHPFVIVGHGGLHDCAGFRAQVIEQAAPESARPQTMGEDRLIFGVLCALVAFYLCIWWPQTFSMGRLIVWVWFSPYRDCVCREMAISVSGRRRATPSSTRALR
jgi:hypothetical protein